jgi:glyoxylase-like metal-dependent hydrolase (beta-lactamase superfamily II)
MKTFPICSDIYYVGVNDRTKTLFENQLPLVCGVSYNSYLIVDEKVALIDTADSSCFEVYLKKIRAVLGDRKIDYLIVNHMEPDHSGSISLIRQYYPEITIVGNAKTFGMIEGFYGVTGNEMQILELEFLFEYAIDTFRNSVCVRVILLSHACQYAIPPEPLLVNVRTILDASVRVMNQEFFWIVPVPVGHGKSP